MTVRVATQNGPGFTVESAVTFRTVEGELHLYSTSTSSPSTRVATYAPGIWASATIIEPKESE